MSTEIEIKLRLPDERTAGRVMEDARVRAGLMTPFSETEMKSVYYDTAAGDIAERKWSLRVRLEGGVPVASLKTLGQQENGLFSRSEWQVGAETIEQAIPLLIAQGAPPGLAGFADYEPKCEVEFVRSSAHLKLADDSVAEMAIDRGTLGAGEKKEPLLELELELLAGLPGAMTELAEWLEERYELSREPASKYVRALRLVRTRPINNEQ